jgi:hypothetical protein
VIRHGPPERGSSLKRSRAGPESVSQRRRHWLTVLRQTPSRRAVPVMLNPEARAKIIRALRARFCAVNVARTILSRSDRSATDNTTIATTPMAILHNESIVTENQTQTRLKTKILRVSIPAKMN